MNGPTRLVSCWCALVFAALAVAPASHAGLTDKIKKKVQDKAAAKVEEVVPPEEPAAADATEPAEAEPTGDSGDSGKVSAVSTKFDYVPGDRVLFADDFTQDELGEFPVQWKLSSGTFEVAEMDGERWLRCASDDGHISMKVPPSLPEFWTLEFDLYGVDPGGSYFTLFALAQSGSTVWEATYPHSGKNLAFRCGDIFSTTPVAVPVQNRHHVMFMARGTALKAYMDRERLANVPDITVPGVPVEFDFRLWAPNMPTKPMITNVRFAEGCRPAKDMLAEGKLVTYGIHFASGSDAVLPESAPVLRQIAAYMEANAAVRLAITGHTDSVGKPAENLDLSKRRAASVAKVLAEQFGVGADRFATDGKGDTEAVASNDKPEGRAMNRRVEFAKL